MKENKQKKLQERLEELHRTQDARLACNADDLDIREEIAEVEEEIKELQDNANVDRKNSIEEDIELLQDETNSLGLFFKCKGSEKYKIALEHILSDYKRVLKENEELKFEERSRIIGKYGDAEIHDVINRTLSNDYISVKKIKDKIEELREQDKKWTEELSEPDSNFKVINRHLKRIKNQIDVLQELLEGRK